MSISEELKFAYLEWLSTPASDRTFLCKWLVELGLGGAQSEQSVLFIRAGLSTNFPFGYWRSNVAFGSDPGRIAWVEHILAGRAPEDFKLPQLPEES